jgi:hypothetical protein
VSDAGIAPAPPARARSPSLTLQSAPWDRARPVAFMPIPKAAGTSVRIALEHALAPARTVTGLCREHVAGFRDFDGLDPSARALVFASHAEVPRGADLIHGHISDAFLRQAYPDAQFVTVLREPHARLLSLWTFCRGLSDAYLAPWGGWAERIRRARQPLRAFLSDRALVGFTDNVAVRMLLAPHRLIPPSDPIAPADDAVLVDEALARLERYAFVDLADNPALGINLGAWIGTPVELPRINRAQPSRDAAPAPLDRELDGDTRALLAERGRLDAVLWAAVARRRLMGDPAALARAVFAAAVARHVAHARAAIT